MSKAQQTKVAHPGKTPAQRRVLDEIGCGNYSPIMDKRTRDALLRQGLIVPLSDRIIYCGSGLGGMEVRIPEFQMPTHVHIQWCYSVGEDEPDDDHSLQENPLAEPNSSAT